MQLQVICWVLGEYGTADGTHSAAYIIGRLYDVAEAHPGDDLVKVSANACIWFIFRRSICRLDSDSCLVFCRAMLSLLLLKFVPLKLLQAGKSSLCLRYCLYGKFDFTSNL